MVPNVREGVDISTCGPSVKLRFGDDFVVVTGQPGAGKTTVAGPLAGRLGLSLVRRHRVHLDHLRVTDDGLWVASPEPHGLSEPVIQVDATIRLNIERISQEVQRHPIWVQSQDDG